MVWSKNVNHRKVGDTHRDDRDWHKAEESYRRHLTTHPDDAAIWVQYGHMLKEQEKFDEAEIAYETATTLAPDEPDGWLQLGHLLKGRDKPAAALEAFHEAMARGGNEGLEAIVSQLTLTVKTTFEPQKAGHEYLFSVQDLFVYLRAHTTMSGIQRVQAGISMEIMEMADVDAGFIVTDFTGALEPGTFWLLDGKDLRGVIEYASGEKVDHPRLRRLLATCERNATPIRAGQGNTLVLLGAFWGLDNTVDRYLPAKREGARLAAYIYDIIPISHPQYCDAGLVRDFTTAVSEICLICDYMLTISDFTRITLDKFLAENGGRAIPTATVPLAHSLTGPPSTVQSWPSSLLRLKGQEYVAYISTIEGRKNHSYVVNVWRKLIEQGVNVPDLVFVGRKGWRINGLMDLLDGTRNLGGRVHIVHDLTDAELNSVYENSLFTVFTSFVEGWGLPVGESLMHHTPCVASGTSSIPEVGGDFVDYVDPENVQDGVAVIGRLLNDRNYLADRKRNIVETFEPRGWKEVASLFVEQMRAHEVLPSVSPMLPYLAEGVQFRPSDLSNSDIPLDDYVANPSRLLVVESFYQPESFGVWMRGRFGEVSFRTNLKEGEPVVAYVRLARAPWYGECKTTVYIGDRKEAYARPLTAGMIDGDGLFRLKGFVGRDGICRLNIDVEGDWEVPPGDVRNFAVGLRGVGYARASNVQARADLLESFTFEIASVVRRQKNSAPS